MAARVYRLLRRHTSTLAIRMLATLSSKWKRLKSAVRDSALGNANFGNFTSSFGSVRLRKVQNARAEPLSCLLDLLFCHVLVAVARSLISKCSSVSYLKRYQLISVQEILIQQQQQIKNRN